MRSKTYSTVPIRVDQKLYDEVKRLAEENHRSVRHQFEYLVERGIDRAGKETR